MEWACRLSLFPVPYGMDLDDSDPLANEWVIAILGPHHAGLLCARQLGPDVPGTESNYDFVVSHDRELTASVARMLTRRLTPRTAIPRHDRSSLDPDQHLRMYDGEPAVVLARPVPPTGGTRGQLVGGCHSQLDRAIGERTGGDAAGPCAAPPLTIGRCGEAPGRGRRCHVGGVGRLCPGQEPPASIWLTAIGGGDSTVDSLPTLEFCASREPRHRGIVGIAHCHDASRCADPDHLPQCPHGIREVLQHLVGVHDVPSSATYPRRRRHPW